MKKLKLIFSFLKKHKIISLILFILLFGLSLYIYNVCNFIYSKSVANAECKKLYLDKINKFSSVTGIVADNVLLNDADDVEVSRNLYTLKWNDSIDIAGTKDSFVCQYNFATKQAIDRSE